uniref:Predicted protein n=1 Tax=Physcomitrium patens TaxID=3218 RepID=A9U5S5_PHYPA
MATLVEEVEEKEAFRFEIDDTQLEEFKALMQDEDIQLPLNFKKTSSGIQVGHTLSIYSSVSKDWYHGSTNHVHVCSSDWQEIDMALKRKEPKLIKIGSHLTHEEFYVKNSSDWNEGNCVLKPMRAQYYSWRL